MNTPNQTQNLSPKKGQTQDQEMNLSDEVIEKIIGEVEDLKSENTNEENEYYEWW